MDQKKMAGSSQAASSVVNGSITSKSIAAGGDDGRFTMTGSTVSTTGTTIIAGWFSGAHYGSWMRFTNITIPQGATITSAKVTVRSSTNNPLGTGTHLVIRGEAADNPTAPTTAAGAQGATKTTASVSWNPGPWNTGGVDHDTPDLATIIQEIVNRAGWASGNALTIYLLEETSTSTDYINPEALENAGTGEPRLTINYQYTA